MCILYMISQKPKAVPRKVWRQDLTGWEEPDAMALTLAKRAGSRNWQGARGGARIECPWKMPGSPQSCCVLSSFTGLSYLAGGMEDRSSILSIYIKHLKLKIYLRLGSHQMCAKPSGCSPLLFWKHEDFPGPSFIFLFLTGHEYQKMFFFHKKR